jgi:5'-3' exonuclease
VHGFIRFLTQFIQQTKAQYIACAFDDSFSQSFRSEIYPPYKANRDPTPNELKRQFILCKKVASAMGIATFSDSNYEADDLIGTLASHYQAKNHRTFIISADKDLAQLIKTNDKWWDYGKTEPLNSEQIYQKFGVYPDQIADYLALTGDSVDNIPGVPGIGAKTAAILLNHFNNLDTIIERHKEIAYLSFRGAKSCKQKIANNVDAAILARKLTGIITDVPIENTNLIRQNIAEDKIHLIFDYLNFGPMLRRRILNIKNI